MAKYNQEQLRGMARTVIDDSKTTSEKWFLLVMRLAAVTGLAPGVVQERIEALAAA